MTFKNKFLILAMTALFAQPAAAQAPVNAGAGSYAPYPPPYKGKTDEHSGFNASMMLSRKIYADETDANGAARPIPTNDWWTDVLNNRFSGALWSYPAMLTTSEEGVTVAWPSHWNENGTEVKADSRLTVGAVKFTATEARATDWHDWDVEILLPASKGDGSILATLTHGVPFSWFEFNDLTPQLTFSATPKILKSEKGNILLSIGADLYLIAFPNSAKAGLNGGELRIDGAEWLSVGLLPQEDDYAAYKTYAASVVRSTTVGWRYDERTSTLATTWDVVTEDLRNPGHAGASMLGFLPHAYKHALDANSLHWSGHKYLTPRGEMRIATAPDGRYSYSYRFSGMLPFYAAPREGNAAENGYDPAMMRQLIEAYANGGNFGDDTYWGGKGLTQMALNMTFAKQTGQMDLYETSKSKLRRALEDWFTYTPGEATKFFAYYPRWGGMLGFDVSYDSDAFNDHHFHYGYFIYASALLCLEDPGFARDYGEILTMIAKDYANYDRNDNRFPFLRNLDPWAGHSYAGGLGDHGNDNGNGQESSSEAMQGWGGVYLLGVALGDKEMRDAGIFGWMTESRGTAEYWFDRDHIRPGAQSNYDYTLYASPYNTNLTSKGIGWWTWFSGDPLWMHSIQWMPVSPCLNYLSEDLDFVKWDYEKMRDATAYSWFEPSGTEAPLADQSVGNVVLCYMERYDPAGAAAIFNEAWQRGMGIARGIDTGHISYFTIQSHLTYGDIDFSVSADCPTANAYRRVDGTMTYIVYNPDTEERTVTFYRNGAALRSVKAPAGALTAFGADAIPSNLEISSESGLIIPPGGESVLKGKCLDQYGASADAGVMSWRVISGDAVIAADGTLSIPATAKRGGKVLVSLAAGNLSAEAEITINDPSRGVAGEIEGVPQFIEAGGECLLSFSVTDQYGATSTAADAEWSITDASGSSVAVKDGRAIFDAPGRYEISASSADVKGKTTLVVLPQLPNVAIGAKATSSSEENVGCLAENAVDGDHSTRWGSKHTDSEWIQLDLGADYLISSVTIDWEAAYGADYDILVSKDGQNWTSAFEQRGLAGAGVVRHPVATEGRYVRIDCLKRGSVYGYSILELEVGGMRADAAADAIVGIDIQAPSLMMEGSTATLVARAFNIAGEVVKSGNVEWSCSPEGEFVGNDFTPTTYGLHTLTARLGAMTASATVLVEESTKLHSLSATPENLSLLTGDEGYVNIEGRDQFGGVYPIDPASLRYTLTTSEGKDVDPSATRFSVEDGVFSSDVRGDFLIDFAGMARVDAAVREVSEANLAAGKGARASSSNGGNIASNVTDLNLQTRWESEARDGEWISIDLESSFILDRVVLRWEGAYDSAYSISTSLDGENWSEVYATEYGRGGIETIALPDVPASFIRLNCLKRATSWGNSLYEIEVYGKDRFEAENRGELPVIGEVTIIEDNGVAAGKFAVSHSSGCVFTRVTLRDEDGHRVGQAEFVGEDVEFRFENILTGDYSLEIAASDAFGNTAEMTRQLHVDYSVAGINIALGKPAEATSAENAGLSAANAVDGDLSTRWGSEFRDNESIKIDLVDYYRINRMVIHWNAPAYASEYTIESSMDGEQWQLVSHDADCKGGKVEIAIDPHFARYVRVIGNARATAYGTSIDEIELYADDIIAAIGEINVSDPFGTGNVNNCNGEGTEIYTIDGLRLPAADAVRLTPGLYILRQPDGRPRRIIIN